MSRKNFQVATDDKGQTTLVKIEKTNVPTGKVITLEDKKKRKEAREEAYRSFRIAALERRAARMGLTEEEISKAKEKLIAQLNEPNNYMILLLYSGTIRDSNGKMNPIGPMVEQAVLNNNLKWVMKSNSHMYIEGDASVLATIREIMPMGVKIHPYVKKKPVILPKEEPPKVMKIGHSKADRKAAAAKAKLARKAKNKSSANNRKKNKGKAWAKVQKQIKLLKTKKERKAKIAHMSNKKASKSLKTAA